MYDFNKVLLKPHIDSLDANSQRIRRNLIVAAMIAYMFSIASNGIDISESSFAGIKFSNLKTEYIYILLILSLLYLLVHFVWAEIDHLKENKLRLTGIVIPMVEEGSSFIDKNALQPNTDIERDSTIFSWWWREKERASDYKEFLPEIKSNIKAGNHEHVLNRISQDLNEIQYKSSYIEEALTRFEKGFWHYQRSQLLRWIFLDFSVPVLMGFFAIISVVIGLYS